MKQIPKFERFKNARVAVIGDVMLDRYWHGSASRISPEAPVPVVKVEHHEERPGGAGNVALNLATLGCQVTLCGKIGDDEHGTRLENKLLAAGIDCHLQRLPELPTITKLRVLSQHQQLLRLDFEELFYDTDSQALLSDIAGLIQQPDILVLSDYGKGTLNDVSAIIGMARAAGIPILVDPKGKDFSLYRGATLLTPNRREFEMVVGPCRGEQQLIEAGHNAIEQHDLSAILVTRGSEGMTLIQRDAATLHLPAHAQEVYDVTGAGDTVIATLACALAAGESLTDAVPQANWAASIVVAKSGAATVTVPELRRAMLSDSEMGGGNFSEERVLLVCQDARSRGERIVFTNGCFDLLHAGHVTYLEQAKALGDRLIVGVNDDASVARLKGDDRPINSLERRMAVLSALQAVDWVVPFSEDTPARIIERILPDVLVKGGDYKADEIVGADVVSARGGDVRVLPFVEGCSTTRVVNKIKQQEIA